MGDQSGSSGVAAAQKPREVTLAATAKFVPNKSRSALANDAHVACRVVVVAVRDGEKDIASARRR